MAFLPCVGHNTAKRIEAGVNIGCRELRGHGHQCVDRACHLLEQLPLERIDIDSRQEYDSILKRDLLPFDGHASSSLPIPETLRRQPIQIGSLEACHRLPAGVITKSRHERVGLFGKRIEAKTDRSQFTVNRHKRPCGVDQRALQRLFQFSPKAPHSWGNQCEIAWARGGERSSPRQCFDRIVGERSDGRVEHFGERAERGGERGHEHQRL